MEAGNASFGSCARTASDCTARISFCASSAETYRTDRTLSVERSAASISATASRLVSARKYTDARPARAQVWQRERTFSTTTSDATIQTNATETLKTLST